MPTIDLSILDMNLAVFGNTPDRWAIAGGIAFVVFAVLTALRGIIMRRTRAEAEADPLSWEATLRALVGRIWTLFLLIVALFAGAQALDIPEKYNLAVTTTISIAILVQLALIGDEAVKVYAGQYVRRGDSRSTNINNAISLIQFLARTAVWSLAALMVLSNLGVDVTALVAGLGVGGIAIALAAQNILSDLFASLAIILDKPFVVGDFITFGEDMGTVERIGIKTTRLKSISGEQIVAPNADLLSTRIRNMRRMEERRIVFDLGVVYETPFDTLKRIPGILTELVESQPKVRFDRAHFASYGDFSLNFQVVYFVLSRDYNEYMDIQQGIYFSIFKRFEEEGIEFAYPTRTVIVAGGQVAADTAEAAAG